MTRIAKHKRKIWKAMEHTIGMRIPLILAFLILTLVPLLVQVRFTSGYFYQSHVEERMAEAQNRSLILANKIRSSDYINVLLSGNPNPALDAELSTTADLMNGRIVLVDDSFKILKDTFGLSRGKTLVVSDVLKAFDGETSSYLNQKKKYFYVAQPIQAKSTDAAPIDSDVAAGKGKNTAGVQGVLLLMASTENSALLQEKIVQKTGFLQLVMFCFILIADLLAAACLLKPFRRLQQQLDMVAEGNLDQDIDVKTRSIITVVALMSQGITDSSLKFHLQNAKDHGVTQKEIAAIITHVGFYAGWPKAWAVFNLAKEVWEVNEGDLPYEDEAMRAHAKSMVFPIGAPNDGFAQYFVGQSYLAPVSTEQVGVFNVTFEPACRNNWHIHHAKSGGGQMIICVAGRGYYQEEGKEAIEMKPGDCINILPEVKHWHGAAPDSWFSHLAIEVPGEETSNEWCEAVTDEQYGKLK